MDGLINVYKQAGWTSQDVCARLRTLLHTRKVGHTGTLDPDAEGVLVVCVGSATRLVERLTDHDKEYIAVCRLGVTTDTGDLGGQVLSTSPVDIDRQTLKECVMRFVGDYDQIPPMYSAIKVGGKKLYELAREGKTVERKVRRVHISSIALLDTRLLSTEHLFTIEVRCSKGTYIRTLCEDIGEALHTGGAMAHLLRTAVGSFRLEQALTIDKIEEAVKEGRMDDIMLPVSEVFRDYDKMKTLETSDKKLHNGNALYLSDFSEHMSDTDDDRIPEEGLYTDGARIRVFDSAGIFYAIYRYDGKKKQFVTDTFLHG